MGNAPSEDAAVGLAPGMEEIRPTDEPASAARTVQPHATEIVVTSSFRNAGEGEPAEGENAINGAQRGAECCFCSVDELRLRPLP